VRESGVRRKGSQEVGFARSKRQGMALYSSLLTPHSLTFDKRGDP